MNLASIASGSSGNCIYVGNEKSHFLIDAGISRKRIVEGLTQMEVAPETIQGIFVTHEHMDHISGLGVFLRKYPVPVFATAKTIDEILSTSSLGKVDKNLFESITPDLLLLCSIVFYMQTHYQRNRSIPYSSRCGRPGLLYGK